MLLIDRQCHPYISWLSTYCVLKDDGDCTRTREEVLLQGPLRSVFEHPAPCITAYHSLAHILPVEPQSCTKSIRFADGQNLDRRKYLMYHLHVATLANASIDDE